MIPSIIHIKYLYISSTKLAMLENYNYLDETELLSLMLNKDEFLRYITQQYNNNKYCTQLEPLIWAIHLNIPKHQRLLLLENIILQSAQYIKTRYSFLPEKLILGKTYEVLGIPTVCGEPDKCFINAYKKYKSYYPVRYPKKEKSLSLNNVICDSIEIKTNQNSSKIYSKSTIANQEILCSTPATNRIPSFEIYPLISPIFDKYISSTDIFCDKDSISSENKNKTQNNMNDMQMLSTPKILEFGGFNILNTSSKSAFNDVQNLNVTETNYLDNTESQMVLISRSPKHIQTINNNSQSYENDLSNTWSEESLKTVTKDKNSTISAYFDDLKKEKYEELTFKTTSKLYQGENSTGESKQSLSGKIKNNLEPKHSKKLQIRKTHSEKKNKHKTKNTSNTKSKKNESWMKQMPIFSDVSFSDSNNTLITKKSNLWTSKCRYTIEQESFKLGLNDTWEKNINNLSSDVESTSFNSRENIKTNKNFSLISNLREQDKNIKHNESSESNTSSSMFSNNCNFLPNWKSDDSLQLESIKHKFKTESQDSCDSNYNFKENYTENNKKTVPFKKILFENISESISKVNLSLLSAVDTSLSSACTVNTSTHITSSASSEKRKID